MVPMWALEDASSYLQLEESLYVQQQQQLESWGPGDGSVVHIQCSRTHTGAKTQIRTEQSVKLLTWVHNESWQSHDLCSSYSNLLHRGTNSCFAESISAHSSKTVRMIHFGWSIAVKYHETQFGPVHMPPQYSAGARESIKITCFDLLVL